SSPGTRARHGVAAHHVQREHRRLTLGQLELGARSRPPRSTGTVAVRPTVKPDAVKTTPASTSVRAGAWGALRAGRAVAARRQVPTLRQAGKYLRGLTAGLATQELGNAATAWHVLQRVMRHGPGPGGGVTAGDAVSSLDTSGGWVRGGGKQAPPVLPRHPPPGHPP